MARILCVHGIAQELKSDISLQDEWAPSLRGGVSLAGGSLPAEEIVMTFYGVLYRPAGKGAMGPQDVPDLKPGDMSEIEVEMLEEMCAEIDPNPPDDAQTEKKGLKRGATWMLQLVGNTPFFGKVAQKFVIRTLRQVSRYFSEPAIRTAARQSMLEALAKNPEVRVVVAHSLGTIVAFETLAANPTLPVHTLITLGSPLGMPALLKRLKPPITRGSGHWPGGLQAWTNIADAADIVALRKRLAPIFDARIVDHEVNNGATMHDVKPYLTARETGRAIMAGLAR